MSLLKSFSVKSCKYIGYVFNKYKYINQKELNLKDFECKKDYDGKIVRNIYSIPYTNKDIGYIEYNKNTGVIGYSFVDKDYRKKKLFTQMFENVKEELRNNNVKTIYFYSNAKEIENKFEKDINIKKIYRGEYNSPLYMIDIV
jgi:hypothetical protein